VTSLGLEFPKFREGHCEDSGLFVDGNGGFSIVENDSSLEDLPHNLGEFE